jgi:hypothetical protein
MGTREQQQSEQEEGRRVGEEPEDVGGTPSEPHPPEKRGRYLLHHPLHYLEKCTAHVN